MKIRFETTIDDIIAFHRFHYANSPVWRRQVWTQMFILPAILFLILFLGWWNLDPLADHDLFLLIFGVLLILFSIGWAIGIRWFLYSSLARNARKFLGEGRNRIMFGWREMEMVDGRLHLKTELIESSLDLRAIEKIVTDGHYTYVYIASVSAYMIPMHVYPEENFREFVEELMEAWENREAPRPSDADPRDERFIERPR